MATVVLVWDYIKWRKEGPKITASAKSGWQASGIDELEGQDLTYVSVVNSGNLPTTLISWGMYWYPRGINRFNKKKRQAFVVKGGLAGVGEVPKKLEPGDVWWGFSREDEKFRELMRTGKLYVALGFSHESGEVVVRVTANKSLKADAVNGAA